MFRFSNHLLVAYTAVFTSILAENQLWFCADENWNHSIYDRKKFFIFFHNFFFDFQDTQTLGNTGFFVFHL